MIIQWGYYMGILGILLVTSGPSWLYIYMLYMVILYTDARLSHGSPWPKINPWDVGTSELSTASSDVM